MAVLKKIRSRLFSSGAGEEDGAAPGARAQQPARPEAPAEPRYDVRPLTVAQLDECWRLDQRCFVDGEAYSRETFEYLLTSPESVSYRAVTPDGTMVGFIVGLVEPDKTGHVTTLGVAPEHRRRGHGRRLVEDVLAWAAGSGGREVRLWVTDGRARALYEACGFRADGREQPLPHAPHIRETGMSRSL